MIIYQGKDVFVIEMAMRNNIDHSSHWMCNHARMRRQGKSSDYDIIIAPGAPVELRVNEGNLVIDRLKSFPPPKPWWMWWWPGK